ncbi:hypothetical protein [Amycolatopsis sp. H20-H5]|uniref:hypothetical protein n=1 Tax=Amycolatopsis sp. H20-H5 TaxID=3046309 RepID=UPI002DBC636F|nr:hypothetical protein [Amycolatopsis sp. H20-H5]MEC3982814.1 hypothetical protein [Amycolatopsis sp. H20-H5]
MRNRKKHRDVAAYALGSLADPAEFEKHLAGCLRCRRELGAFGEVNDSLRRAVRLGYLTPGDGPTGSGGLGAVSRRTCPAHLPLTANLVLLIAVCVAAAATIPAGPAILNRRSRADAHMASPARWVDRTVVSHAGQQYRPRSAAIQ